MAVERRTKRVFWVPLVSERADYLVLLPTQHDGIDYGDLQPLRVHATDRKHAIQLAVEKWWSGTLMYEGTAVVVAADDATAFVLGEIKGVEIVAESSLPDKLAEKR